MPRCLREAKEVVTKRVVTFVDASLQAYGTAVYLQCVYSNGNTRNWLIRSKCKVALQKHTTMPRLELIGAVLGLRLTQHLALVLGLPIQTVKLLWWVRVVGELLSLPC